LNTIIKSTREQLIEATHIIITYGGTAWVYRNNESMSIVANCHKVPQKNFEKHLLSIDVIQKVFRIQSI
jgi:RAB protein geranylgeranyltransferase component A